MSAHLSKPPVVFISYASEDKEYKDELVKQLNVLEAQGVILNWHDALLVAGEQWDDKIVEQLNASHIILLLISPDFLNSKYIHNVEMKRASERHERGEVVVVPIMVRPVNSWQKVPFGELKLGALNALPDKAKCIVKWGNRDDAFANVAAGIQTVAEKLNEAAKTKGSVAAPPSSIPRSPVFGFVARRDSEGRDIVERLKEELAPGKNKLVTLSGPGGIGKTTLAAEATRSLEGERGSRVVWSSAEKRTDFTLNTLLDDIATQTDHINLRTLAPEAKEAAVRALVADPPTLVVLDNCETIAIAELRRIEEWLAPAQCSALFTSRPRITSTLNIHVAAMSWEEAQEFLQKLIAQTQDAEIFSDEIRRRIYQTAEANPFVMQWVVAQIDAAQEPRTVLEELARGEGDAAQRVFDRSYNLPRLGDDGRATLLALSLFIPSASRPALAEVAGFDDDEGRVNDAIKNLRALWLIKGIDENSRFTIEGLTRSLTQSRLLKDDRADEFRRRFVTHFLRYAEAHAKPTPEDFAALEAEKDNILKAMDVAFELKDWSSVMRLMNAINLEGVSGLLAMHGYWDEAIQRGEQAVTAAHSNKNEAAVAVFAGNVAIMRQLRGEYAEAKQALLEVLAAFRKLGNEINVSIILHQLAILAQAQGEVEEARRLYDESLGIAKRLGHQSGIASTLHQLAILAQDQGEVKEARRLYDESLDIKRRLGHQSGIASTLHQLGRLAQDQGEVEEARRLYDESLDIKRRLGHQSGIASTLHQLAILAQDQGEVKEARRLYDESLDIKRRLGDQSGIANTLHQLGRLAQAQGELEEARRLYNESLEIEQRLGNQDGIAISLWQLGMFAGQEGDRAEGVRLLREALSIFERLKSPNAETVREILARVEGESS